MASWTSTSAPTYLRRYMFVLGVLFVAWKGTSLGIALNYSADCANATAASNATETDLYEGDACRSTVACEAATCSAEGICICDQDASVPLLSEAVNCNSSVNCPSRQVCEVETLRCVYAEVCEGTATHDSTSLGYWLVINSAVGLAFVLPLAFFLILDCALCSDGGYCDAVGTLALIGGGIFGGPYLVFSIGWNAYGWTRLEQAADCEATLLWRWSWWSCVLHYPLLALSPLFVVLLHGLLLAGAKCYEHLTVVPNEVQLAPSSSSQYSGSTESRKCSDRDSSEEGVSECSGGESVLTEGSGEKEIQ